MDVPPRKLCLITGASAGIGEAFARVYAAEGYDLALTARRTERLEALAEEIRRRFGVQALVFTADLAQPGAVEGLVAAIAAEGRTVDALVNNAGYGQPGTYTQTTWSDQQAFLQVLVVAVCELTHRLVPGMAERGFGRVINVASVAGLVPGMPGQTLYGAAKSLVVKFSESLHLEMLGKGMHITVLCPGLTYSEFHDVNGMRAKMGGIPRLMWQDAETVARAGFEAVEANRAICITGWPNKAIVALARLLPEGLVLRLTARASRRVR